MFKLDCTITCICQDISDRKNIILQIKVWENESERRREVEIVGATLTKENKIYLSHIQVLRSTR